MGRKEEEEENLKCTASNSSEKVAKRKLERGQMNENNESYLN